MVLLLVFWGVIGLVMVMMWICLRVLLLRIVCC